MKKLIIFILVLSLIVSPMLTANNVSAESPITNYALSSSSIDELTKKICQELPDRTSFTSACHDAAKALAGESNSLGGTEVVAASTVAEYLSDEGLDIEVQPFTVTATVPEGFGYVEKELVSYNVIAKLKNFDESKKTVLITTNFANHYSTNDAYYGVKAAGALGSAATTALTVQLANYLSRSDATNEYNYVFAFFSGTDEGNFGSAAYVKEHLSSDVMLVINLERLGCGNTYYYTDEAATAHGEFIADLAPSYKMEEFPSVGRVLLQLKTVDDLPYSHYAMRGDVASFLNADKSCLELIGGDFSKLADNEGGDEYVTNTSYDTYENLVKYHPDYADKLALVGQFIIDLTAKAELKSVCVGAATSYKTFTKPWIAYVICLGIILILILVLILVTQYLEKKYPVPAPKKIKIAVFGKEYEDINGDEIIVDIKRDNNNVNPFDV